MIKREAKFQTVFNHWLKAVWKKTGAFELKVVLDHDRLPFSAVKEHQRQALLQVKHGVFVYKISDIGMVQTPWDCFCLAKKGAFVVIRYRNGIAYGIDIDDFMTEANDSAGGRKSLTLERAQELARFKVVC